MLQDPANRASELRNVTCQVYPETEALFRGKAI